MQPFVCVCFFYTSPCQRHTKLFPNNAFPDGVHPLLIPYLVLKKPSTVTGELIKHQKNLIFRGKRVFLPKMPIPNYKVAETMATTDLYHYSQNMLHCDQVKNKVTNKTKKSQSSRINRHIWFCTCKFCCLSVFGD